MEKYKYSSAIVSLEIIPAITRRSRSGSISITDARITGNQFKRDLQKDYQIVEITENIINSGWYYLKLMV